MPLRSKLEQYRLMIRDPGLVRSTSMRRICPASPSLTKRKVAGIARPVTPVVQTECRRMRLVRMYQGPCINQPARPSCCACSALYSSLLWLEGEITRQFYR